MLASGQPPGTLNMPAALESRLGEWPVNHAEPPEKNSQLAISLLCIANRLVR
jgi:hypothetical protein